MATDGLSPDLDLRDPTNGLELDWIHRRTDATDIYFIANLGPATGQVDAAFRVSGKGPELWDPVTGDIRELPEYRPEDGRTVVPLRFEPRQSWFVVFQHPVGDAAQTGARNFARTSPVAELPGPWEVSFDPRWGGPGTVAFETLHDWTTRPEDGIRYYSGTATYRTTFDAPDTSVAWLDLGTVRNLAHVRLNGRDLGILWTAPWRVDVRDALRATDNRLEVDVVNLWPNRLIGDGALPKQDRLTRTNVRTYDRDLPTTFPCWWDPECEERKRTGAQPSLLSSGLMGPVRLLSED